MEFPEYDILLSPQGLKEAGIDLGWLRIVLTDARPKNGRPLQNQLRKRKVL
jgi:hypothetical protein